MNTATTTLHSQPGNIDLWSLRVRRALHRRLSGFGDSEFQGETCPVCGEDAGLRMAGVLWPELVLQWGLSARWANWMDQREGLRCNACGCNLRSRHLAAVLLSDLSKHAGMTASALKHLPALPAARTLRIAEINAAGQLHPFLRALPGLRYSEYGSTDPAVPSQDLMALTYADASFDLVVTSDVLEHVPDFQQALSEIRRVLVPGGRHVFSVPIVWNQGKTRRRAEIDKGQVKHHLPPSHHGSEHANKDDFLVFNEFGADFVPMCEAIGFTVTVIRDQRNPSLVTLSALRA